MIQDIMPKKFDNQYDERTPKGLDYIVVMENDIVMLKTVGEQIMLPFYCEVEECIAEGPEKKLIYLFSIDDNGFFLLDMSMQPIVKERLIQNGYVEYKKKAIRESGPEWMRFAIITAFQLYNWYQKNQYCGCCGKKMKQSDKERMLYCEHCNNMVYPKISPAVIVGVINGEKILLSKYAEGDYKKYALLAGFAEIGETIEETVKREVEEETGLRVKNLKYYKSQPWSFSDTLLLGFFCELDGEDEIRLDETELSEAKWAEQIELPSESDGVSLTWEMIVLFKEKGREVLK